MHDFRGTLEAHFPELIGARLLLAVSGGIDSMVLLDLLQNAGQQIAVAHCNFGLRGNESDADEAFVRDHSQRYRIPFFTTRFDTEQFAHDFKLSTQMAARELRYRWFDELLDQEHYDFLLTAHHADDDLETFLINLSRGTGIAGLTGIPRRNGRIVRPLLGFLRDEIEHYARENRLEWREDSSNGSQAYLRNQLRRQVIPQLKNAAPQMLASFRKTQDFLRQTESMANDAAVLVYRQVAQQAGEEVHFNLEKLLQLPNHRSYLYHWLHDLDFPNWDDLYALTTGESGKYVESPTHKLFRHRHFLILAPRQDQAQESVFEVGLGSLKIPINLELDPVPSVSATSNNVIFVDAAKIALPLTLRKRRDGDVFRPIGLDGHSKKVSKFFKDEGLSMTDRERAWLLCSGDDIAWIVGHRADERFKVTETTKRVLRIAYTP